MDTHSLHEHQHCKLSLYIRFCFLNFVSRSVITVHISRYMYCHIKWRANNWFNRWWIGDCCTSTIKQVLVTVTRYSCICKNWQRGKENRNKVRTYDWYIKKVRTSSGIFIANYSEIDNLLVNKVWTLANKCLYWSTNGFYVENRHDLWCWYRKSLEFNAYHTRLTSSLLEFWINIGMVKIYITNMRELVIRKKEQLSRRRKLSYFWFGCFWMRFWLNCTFVEIDSCFHPLVTKKGNFCVLIKIFQHLKA